MLKRMVFFCASFLVSLVAIDSQAQVVGGQPIPPVGPKERCEIAGCSGQLCLPESKVDNGGGISICAFLPEYICLQYSRCGRVQSGGVTTCGWRNTPQYQACLVGVEAAKGYYTPIISQLKTKKRK